MPIRSDSDPRPECAEAAAALLTSLRSSVRYAVRCQLHPHHRSLTTRRVFWQHGRVSPNRKVLAALRQLVNCYPPTGITPREARLLLEKELGYALPVGYLAEMVQTCWELAKEYGLVLREGMIRLGDKEMVERLEQERLERERVRMKQARRKT